MLNPMIIKNFTISRNVQTRQLCVFSSLPKGCTSPPRTHRGATHPRSIHHTQHPASFETVFSAFWPLFEKPCRLCRKKSVHAIMPWSLHSWELRRSAMRWQPTWGQRAHLSQTIYLQPQPPPPIARPPEAASLLVYACSASAAILGSASHCISSLAKVPRCVGDTCAQPETKPKMISKATRDLVFMMQKEGG